MKRILTLSFLLIAGLTAAAQAPNHKHPIRWVDSLPSAQPNALMLDHSRIIVGHVDTLSTKVASGLQQAKRAIGKTQLALVAAHPFTSAYYTVYNRAGQVVAAGKFTSMQEGDVEIINLYDRPDRCRVEIRDSRVFVNAKRH